MNVFSMVVAHHPPELLGSVHSLRKNVYETQYILIYVPRSGELDRVYEPSHVSNLLDQYMSTPSGL
jgi:hypothetical protein